MTSTRPLSPDDMDACALLQGAPECECTQDAAGLTDDQIVARALNKLR